MTCHQKFKLTIVFTEFLHDVNNPVLKGLCKFQVDIQKNARVTLYLYYANYYSRTFFTSYANHQLTMLTRYSAVKFWKLFEA